MIDYPVAPPAGRIRRLEDRDGDGVYERATVFADGLPFPNGVLPCFGGVLVTAAPDIVFLRDDDGDGRAEVRRVVLTGFGDGEHPAPGQRPVPGDWTTGSTRPTAAATARSAPRSRRRSKAVSISRRDLRFRFRPDTKDVEIEAIAGFSQFGLAHDDWGNRFPSWNTIPIRHVVLEQADTRPQPVPGRDLVGRPRSSTRRMVAGSIPSARSSPGSIASRWTTSTRPAGRRSSAATGFPRTFAAMPSCASRSRTWCTTARSSRRAARSWRSGSSPGVNSWHPSTRPFRPVNLATGPDGALYVVDMYREMVEHPDFVPADLRAGVEFRRWHDKGRICAWVARTSRREPGPPILAPGSRRPAPSSW